MSARIRTKSAGPRAASFAALLFVGGCTYDGETVTWTAEPDPPRRHYYPLESARIDEDLRRLADDKPLKHHDDEEELRRHDFERDFYENLWNSGGRH